MPSPVQPELMSGTPRENLDPFHQHDNTGLNDALRSAGLFSLYNGTVKVRITLDRQNSRGQSVGRLAADPGIGEGHCSTEQTFDSG